MSLIGERVLLRIYLQSADRAPLTPSYELIVKAARKHGLAGATVLRGILGAGYHGLLKESHWGITQHVPVIVEIVDSAEKIAAFIEGPLDPLMNHGMLTLERAAVVMYRHGGGGESGKLSLAKSQRPLSTLPALKPGTNMTLNENGVLLRIFIGESDRLDKQPLYEAIVTKTRELGLAGATVLRGSEGFGAHSVVHKSRLLEMSADLPIVIEIVDSEEKINSLLPSLETMVTEGMVTMEYVAIIMYRAGNDPLASAPPIR